MLMREFLVRLILRVKMKEGRSMLSGLFMSAFYIVQCYSVPHSMLGISTLLGALIWRCEVRV